MKLNCVSLLIHFEFWRVSQEIVPKNRKCNSSHNLGAPINEIMQTIEFILTN